MASRLVIEWTRATLRLALAEGGDARLKLRSVYCQPISAPEAAVPTLKTLLKSAKVGAADVVGIVSREQVITRVVKFPTADSTELGKMVELYAKAQLPYAREQAITDFHVLARQEGFTTVAIVACQREVIDRHISVLSEAGLSVRMLTLSPWGVLGWYRQMPRQAGVKEPCLVVNVDDTRTDLVLIADGRILSSRSIGQGFADWAQSGDTTQLLSQEVERSRVAVRKELPDAEVQSVILTGLAASTAFAEPLSQAVELPVLAVDSRQPFKGCIIPTSPAISPVVVGGVACSDFKGLLNLSPVEMRATVRHHQQVQELVVVGLLLLGVLAAGAGLLSLKAARQHQLASRLEQAIGQVQPAAKQAQEKSRAEQFVDAVLSERRRLAQLLASLFGNTPGSINLEAVTFERARHELVVRGSSASTQEVLAYVSQLQQMEGVSAVQLKYSTTRSTPAGDRTDFELAIQQRKAKS